MKALLLLTFWLASFAHGGVLPFPDERKLELALETVKASLLRSNLDEGFIQKTVDRMTELRDLDLFKASTDLALMGTNGHKILDPMAGMAAVALKGKDAPILFSTRALSYEDKAFARLLLHEVLHQTIDGEIAADEIFVDDLAEAVLKGTVTPLQSFALKNGFQPQALSLSQLLDGILRKLEFKCEGTAHAQVRDCDESLRSLRASLKKESLEDMTIDNFLTSTEKKLSRLEAFGWEPSVGGPLQEQMLLAFASWMEELDRPVRVATFKQTLLLNLFD